MAETYDWGPDSWEGEINRADIGIAVFICFRELIKDDPDPDPADGLIKDIFGNGRKSSEELEATEAYTRREAEVYFPEMEEIVKKAYGVHKKSSSRVKGKQTLSQLVSDFETTAMDLMSGEDSDAYTDIMSLADSYIEARKLYPNKLRKDAPTQEEIEELDELQDRSDALDTRFKMGDFDDEESAYYDEEAREEFDAAMEETGATHEDLAEAMHAVNDFAYDNTEDEELWGSVNSCLADLHLLPKEAVPEGTEEKERSAAATEILRKTMESVRPFLESIEDALRERLEDEDEADVDDPMYLAGFWLRQNFEEINPDVVEYFLYRYALENHRIDRQLAAREEAAKNGLRGKRAEKYAAKKAGYDDGVVEEEYEEDYLAFFRGMNFLENLSFRLAKKHGIVQKGVENGSFQWHLSYFCMMLGGAEDDDDYGDDDYGDDYDDDDYYDDNE